MFFRAYQSLSEDQSTSPDQTFMKEEKTYFFLIASTIVIISGLLCLFLDESWTRNFSSFLKVPIYILVAQSLTYIITFGVIDFLNFVLSNFQSLNSLNFVETQDQIIALMVNCFASGMFYGLIFGLMDIEDDRYWKMKKDFLCEERLCLPIGVLGGFAAGFCNEILRNNVKN